MTPSVEMPKRRALGKGLESLLPGALLYACPCCSPAVTAPARRDDGKPRRSRSTRSIAIPSRRATVDESALNELAASIAATGVVQPVLVRPLADDRFQLIAGERRWLASKRPARRRSPPSCARCLMSRRWR